MKLSEFLNQLNLGNLSILLFLVLSLVEIAPIKINPLRELSKLIQHWLGLDEIKDDLMDLRRTRIIRFDNELIAHQIFQKDMFDAILVDCDKYEKYCKSYKGYINSVANDSIRHIKEVYAEEKRKNGFLKD